MFHPKRRPWSVACEIAFPCATQNEVDEADALALIGNGCKIVVEGANMPLTPQATAILRNRGVIICPAKAANAGKPTRMWTFNFHTMGQTRHSAPIFGTVIFRCLKSIRMVIRTANSHTKSDACVRCVRPFVLTGTSHIDFTHYSSTE